MHYVQYSLTTLEERGSGEHSWIQLHSQFKVAQLYDDLENIRSLIK